MEKQVTVVAHNVHNSGLVHLRIRQIFSKLSRKKYKIDYIDFQDFTHADGEMADIIVMPHARSQEARQLMVNNSLVYNSKVVLDIDDCLDEIPRWHQRYGELKVSHTPGLLQGADAVVVSTLYLMNRWNHLNENIRVIENMVDADRYRPYLDIPRPHKSGFVIGLTGAEYHSSNWIIVKDALRTMMDRYEDVRVQMHVAMMPGLEDYGLRVFFNDEAVDWPEWPRTCSQYPFDVCLVPLHKCAFNDAKSDLRMLDMGMYGVPVIASCAESYRQQGQKENCFVVNDSMWSADPGEATRQWVQMLEYAYKNQEQLKEVGQRARKYIETHRLLDHAVRAWDDLLEGL